MAEQNKVITLTKDEKKILEQYVTKDNKISCFDAIKVSEALEYKTIEMSDICKTLDIKITDCKLGVFGSAQFAEYNDEIYQDISEKFKDNTDVACASLWKLANKYSLLEVGSTVKKSNIEVVQCRLGCFTTRKAHRRHKEQK